MHTPTNGRVKPKHPLLGNASCAWSEAWCSSNINGLEAAQVTCCSRKLVHAVKWTATPRMHGDSSSSDKWEECDKWGVCEHSPSAAYSSNARRLIKQTIYASSSTNSPAPVSFSSLLSPLSTLKASIHLVCQCTNSEGVSMRSEWQWLVSLERSSSTTVLNNSPQHEPI